MSRTALAAVIELVGLVLVSVGAVMLAGWPAVLITLGAWTLFSIGNSR